MTGFSAIARLLRFLPAPATPFLVEKVMVRSLMMAWPSRRRVALANLSRILEHVGRKPGEGELSSLLDQSLHLYSRFILCMIGLPGEERAAREEVDLDLLPALESLRSEGRGVVLATPNFGLVGHALWALRLKGLPMLLPILNRDFLAHHEAGVFAGVSTVGESARPSLRSLREGGVVAAIVDINYLPHRPATPFFGAPAPLGYAASRLARTSGAPLLPAYAVVRAGRCRFESHEPIDPRGRSLEEVNLLLARSMERAIGEHPEQWLVYNDFWNLEAMELEYRLARGLARWS